MRPRLTSRPAEQLAVHPVEPPAEHSAPRRAARPGARSVIAAVAVASALVLSGCSSSGGGSSDGANTSFVQGTGEISTAAVGHRGDPIDLTGNDLDGKSLSLSSYRGKVVVINVWGSWCAPCQAEAADFETVYKQYQGKGVQFIGIDTRDLQTAAAQAFVTSHGLTYPSLYDPDGELLLKFPVGSLNPQAIPSTLVLDRSGRIAVRALEPLLADQLSKIIAPVLAEKS